jgi:hypothetical protein
VAAKQENEERIPFLHTQFLFEMAFHPIEFLNSKRGATELTFFSELRIHVKNETGSESRCGLGADDSQ